MTSAPPPLSAGARASTPPRVDRTGWIDTAKGLGILLVVIGHAAVLVAGNESLRSLVYLFHMPLFFMISGLLLKPEVDLARLRAKFGRFGRPYVAYLLLFGPVFQTFVVYRALRGQAGWEEILLRSAEDLVLGGRNLGGALTIFWFLPVLFVGQQLLAFAAGRRFATPWRLLVASAVLAVAAAPFVGSIPPRAAPLDLPVVLLILVHLQAGVVVAPILAAGGRTYRILVAGAAVAATAGLLIWWNDPSAMDVDLKAGLTGLPVIGPATSIAIAVVVLAVCREADRLAPLRVFRTLGRASLTIMFVHAPVIHIASVIRGIWPWLISTPAVVVIAMAVGLSVHFVFERSSMTRRWFLGETSPPTKEVTGR